MHDNHSHSDHLHNHSLFDELVCHLPYAIFAVAFGLSLLSFMSFLTFCTEDQRVLCRSAHILFHSFHFMHIVFAATGTLITFLRFSKSTTQALLVGIFSPVIFCTLSDNILPYIGGRMLGVNMHFHMCFFTELHNVLPFLFVGILNGFILGKYHAGDKGLYSLFSHAVHILISSLASIFYLVSHGFTDWYTQIGFVFLFLVGAVVLPCTLSDVVIPMVLARAGGGNEKH
jgi:hypothetical protein